ncbi:TonB-dependent siderophore receptor [Aestuariibacter sp. A3R04]|uniref:TonB-dependent receptor plug domain-containing protein n=1 Tax=Aestuariibacter sp. A3R04 TaxID=2841571 RepID=UPI001C087FFE|nr:TonB-dependent receptor [Aestuariibacter sp. A3R04]MBU3021474.1 TonB-dependent receptor [Aestuariibacter sp. A3R04]
MQQEKCTQPAFKLSMVAAALIGAPLSLLSTTVLAQEQIADEDLEKIQVVGSRRVGRTVNDSPVPIDIIDASSIEATGLTETNMILNSLLPSFNFPQPSITDGTDHVRPAQLRGLAPDHTLVLVNGKRRHTSALLNLNGSVGRGSSAVDLNAIPANAIKRIEVLRDGAAAQYGSDAIAGVINIVLKDASEGGDVSVTYGANVTTMDGVPDLDSVSVGDDGNLDFTTGSDRSVTDGQTVTVRGNMGFEWGADGFVNVSAEYRDRGQANRADFDPRENYARDENGDVDERELTVNRYNHVYGNGEVEDYAVFINAGKSINDEVEFYSTAGFSQRDSLGGGFYRRAQDDRNILSIYPDGFLPSIQTDITDMSLLAGIKGYGDVWNYDLSVTHGSNELEYSVVNTLNTSLGPTSPTQFDAGALEYTTTIVNADASRLVDTGAFYSEMNFAMGAEYRHEGYEITAGEEGSYIRGDFGPGGAVTDPLNGPFGAAGSQVFPGFTPESAGDNSRHNYSFYVDVEADVLENWNVAVAGRYEDYSDFGSTFNWKMSHRVTVTDAFALRASVSTGFRAPSLQQQYFTSIATVFVDGVPTETGTFAPSSDVAQALGSPGLDAEESENYSAGFTYSPNADFNLTVDFYRIDIDDRIVLSNNLSGDAIEALLAGTGANRARFFLNAINSRTEGVDIVSTYTLNTNDWGAFNFNAGINFNDNEVTGILDAPDVLQGAGFDQSNLFDDVELRRFETSSPDSKINLGVTWNYDRYTTTLRTTRYGEVEDPSSIEARNEIIPSEWVTDLDVRIALTDGLSVSIGANNLFDVYPEATRNNVEDVTTFSNIFPYSGFSAFGFTGRYVYGKVSYVF